MAIEMSEFDNFDPHEGKFVNTDNSEDALRASGVFIDESKNDKKFTLDEALALMDEAKNKGSLKDGDIIGNYIYNAVTDSLISLDNILEGVEDSEICDNDIEEVDFADSEDEVIEFEISDNQDNDNDKDDFVPDMQNKDGLSSAESEVSFKIGRDNNYCICTLGKTTENDITDISTRRCPLANRGTCKRYSQLMSIYKPV